jgi:hypothetical protein
MGDWTNYFFLSDDRDIVRFTLWHLFYFFVLTGSWIPIWRQSEKKQPVYNTREKRASNKSVAGNTLQNVVYYGYQTRKRREWRARLYARWVLMNPDYLYNGFMWTFFFLFAAAGCYYAQTNGDVGDIRSVALWLAGFQATLFGMWTIGPFYWDMPGWSILYLSFTSLMSVAVSWLYAYLDWWAFGLYSAFTLVQIVLTAIYAVAFLMVVSGNNTFKVGNPIRELFHGNGLHPISFLERDVYPDLPMDPEQELAKPLGPIPLDPVRAKVWGTRTNTRLRTPFRQR